MGVHNRLRTYSFVYFCVHLCASEVYICISVRQYDYIYLNNFFTDSLYMALSGQSLDELVKPHLRVEWESAKKKWFPSEENYAHDLREPGR